MKTESLNNAHSSFLWNHRGLVLNLSLALPVALQVGSVALKVAKDPQIVVRKISNAKQFYVRSFTQQPNETEDQFKKRIIKNVLIASAFILGTIASVVCPFAILPASFAIPIALSILFLAGEVILDAEKYAQKLSAAWTWVRDAFTQREGESDKDATLRILRNAAIVSVIAAAAIGIGVALHAIALHVMHALADGTVRIWNLYNLLPSQTPLTVFLEYASVGIAHGVLAVKKWNEGEKKAALFHFVNMILGFFFPLFYQFSSSEMRLHHSFLGLLISLAPSNSLKALGSLMTVDSFLYVFAPFRGYWTTTWWGAKKWESWDFQNLLLEHIPQYFGAYSTSTAAEIALKQAS